LYSGAGLLREPRKENARREGAWNKWQRAALEGEKKLKEGKGKRTTQKNTEEKLSD